MVWAMHGKQHMLLIKNTSSSRNAASDRLGTVVEIINLPVLELLQFLQNSSEQHILSVAVS